MNIFLLLGICLAGAQVTSTPQQSSSVAPDLPTIIQKLEHAQSENRSAFQPYSVTRDYRLFDDGQQEPRATVLAEVTFFPPDSKDYQIQQSKGSGTGEKVVRKILDHEKEMAKDDGGQHDLSRSNYDFAYVGEQSLDGVRCYVLRIHPKRDDKNLLEGSAWIDAQSFMPRRIEGTPTKSPSWWVRKMTLAMSYGPVAGMWLPIGSRADADIRVFGKHTLTSRDVRYQRLDAVAANHGRRLRRHSTAAGLGVIFPE